MKITDMSFEEYFSSQNEFIEKSSSNDQIIKNENENEMKSQKNEKIEEDGKNPSSSSSGAKKEYARTMTSSIYLCPNFPITLDDLLPALEVFFYEILLLFFCFTELIYLLSISFFLFNNNNRSFL